ncbi:PTS transporter subunit EIIC [Vibrio sp. DW001]|uniref:PTS transporter subunit EIIC n=1 Tax=Vibrio sp. DW001 TaxID=2912315 RepID=UPI0023AF4576|nr:PTS transporter subunit EIIC [Vibrio sp. DW001]WED25748.1 PTS transporter subunit EIIC [Vibrio sp. DW001]
MAYTLNDFKNQLSKLGRAMLIPIAAQPIAGLLARFGHTDLLDIQILLIAANVIFGNIDMLFAIGAVVAFAKTKDKTTSILAAIISLMIFKKSLEYVNPDLNMGVFAGIIIGVLTAILYNHSREWKTPNMFSFFTGEKFVVTLGPLLAVPLGILFAQFWAPIEHGLNNLAILITLSGAIGIFLFGVLNRLLIPVGLHHVLNSYIFFEVGSFTTSTGTVVTGEIPRFLSGDPTAGGILAMFFVVMMFGLPGAALAMYHTAKPTKKKEAKAAYGSGAVTSFVTGITEPLEFMFMFLAPQLYLIHALLTGTAGVILYFFNVKLGISFGFCIIDYGLNYNLGTNSWIILPVGLVYFLVYYFTFKLVIERRDYKIFGREDDTVNFDENVSKEEYEIRLNHDNYQYMSKKIMQYIGGKDNIVDAECCVTRLRLELHDGSLVDAESIKKTGAKAVVKVSDTSIQVVIGTDVGKVMKELNKLLDM